MNQRLSLLILIFLCLFLNKSVLAQWTNGQNATYVIGQPNFTSKIPSLTQNGLDDPEGIAVDLINQKLYVADGNENRILRYSLPITSNQPNAEIVFGQANFTTDLAATSQNGLHDPRGVWVDESGRLWVADYENNRVIWFNKAHEISTNQPLADGVLGQSTFTSNSNQLTPNGMYGPCDLVTDKNGHLWIVDSQNHRVIRFNTAATKSNGAAADGVLGQLDFISNARQTTQNGLDDPEGITINRNGTIWVSDDNNNRILRFNNAFSKANGSNADGVLGQLDFTSKQPQLTAYGIDGASGIYIDCRDNLYAVDKNQNRLLIFENAENRANGASANSVLGQPNFTTGGANLTQNGLDFISTAGVTAYENQLLIVDSRNKRVIVQNINYPIANAQLCGLNVANGPVIGKIEPIPTMSEWGLIIFGLLVLNLSVYFLKQLELNNAY